MNAATSPYALRITPQAKQHAVAYFSTLEARKKPEVTRIWIALLWARSQAQWFRHYGQTHHSDTDWHLPTAAQMYPTPDTSMALVPAPVTPAKVEIVDGRAALVDSQDVHWRALGLSISHKEARKRFVAEGRTLNRVQQNLYEVDCGAPRQRKQDRIDAFNRELIDIALTSQAAQKLNAYERTSSNGYSNQPTKPNYRRAHTG